MIAQQIIFGYRDGHRRLGGSVELDKAADAALLGATDASVGPRTKRLITALPLPSVGLYALCGTWPAPEGGRPGAVWAHALLLPLDELDELNALETPAAALRRPSSDALADFARPLSLEADVQSRRQFPDPKLLAQLLAAATEPRGVPVITANDLGSGEAALFALWDNAWPALRATLSFRTRERVKATPELSYICVARRITGMWRPQAGVARMHAAALAESRWVHELARDPSNGGRSPRELLPFLRAFGPEGVPRLTQLVSLGELHELVQAGDAGPVAQVLAAEHPKHADSPALKRALFGRRHADWWDPTELDVIAALFAIDAKGFDLKPLELAPRVRRMVADGHVTDLISARSRPGAKRLRSILVDALVQEATPSLLSEVLRADRDMGEDVARARPELLEETKTWSTITDRQAGSLAAAVDLSDRALAAAVLAGRYSDVKRVVSLPTAAVRLARARELQALRKLLTERAAVDIFAGEQGEDLRIELAAEGIEIGSLGELLDALEARRDDVDDTWLRAAVYALSFAGRERQRATLEVVFGPLHNAITDDRLPHELWEELGKLAPPADDPALRLRRLLLTRARDERWPRPALERALRGSGPHVQELKADIDGDDDDPFVALMKATLKAWRRFLA